MATAGHDSRGDKVTVVGLKGTVRNLKALDADIGPEIKKISLAAAELVKMAAIARAPVGNAGEGDKHPGRLRSTIKASGTLYGATVRAGGASTPYTNPIHWGWGRHGIAAQKFIVEALDEKRVEVFTTYEHGVEALVERSFAKAGD